MFSQNVLAESPASCSLSFPLCTSEEGTRRPQKHVFFSEVVREAQVHQRPGQEVSARWLRIIQSWQEAETSPDPNQTAAPERELSQECPAWERSLLCFHSERAQLMGKRERQPNPQEDLLFKQRRWIFHMEVWDSGKMFLTQSLILIKLRGTRASPFPWIIREAEKEGESLGPISSEQGFLNHRTLFQLLILKEKNPEQIF